MYKYLVLVLVLIALVNANNYYDSSDDDYRDVLKSRNFTGKVVLVTGSSSGIGAGIVKLFSALGAHVVVTGRNADQVKNVSRQCEKLSPYKLEPLQVLADVTKTEDLNRLLNQTIKTFGKLDVLVNDAGAFLLASIKDKKNFMPYFDILITTNLRAYVELSHLSVPYLEETNGTIISISCIPLIFPTLLPFSVAKAGIDMMTKVLAVELGPKIRVNAINPGIIVTDNNRNETDILHKMIPSIIKHTPLQRAGSALDIAKSVAFLASNDAQYLTGINLYVDGGAEYTIGGTYDVNEEEHFSFDIL